MSLKQKSEDLKRLVAAYNTEWFLGDKVSLIKDITDGRAGDEGQKLVSPMRQIYYLCGLLISTEDTGVKVIHDPEEWNQITDLLIEIDLEYNKLLTRQSEEYNTNWKKEIQVAMPSFLAYFHQGPLNFEEQAINRIDKLYSPLDKFIEEKTGVCTADFLNFYDSLDDLVNRKFQGFFLGGEHFNEEWLAYTRIEMGFGENVPSFIRQLGQEQRTKSTLVSDRGIINRFRIDDLLTGNLTREKAEGILNLLTCRRQQSEFLYFASDNPPNPLLNFPIVDIGDGIFQVFEVKQVIHSIDSSLSRICTSASSSEDKLSRRKGKFLESEVLRVFKKFFKKGYKYFENYIVDNNEQDLLFLWKDYAFIIEVKNNKIREPFRDPSRAFPRIKDDFDEIVGEGYQQTRRIERKFHNLEKFTLTRSDETKEEIDTRLYEDNVFSIIVNSRSFGQIQNDLDFLLDVEDENYPWVVKMDDLEVFFLTMIAKNKGPKDFIDFLLLREQLHGKLICFDELEVCGALITGQLTQENIDKTSKVVMTPMHAEIFDQQYNKGMGFENEKNLLKKQSREYLTW